MNPDTLLTLGAVALAVGWLARRALKGLRRRERRGCGGGCGCGAAMPSARERR